MALVALGSLSAGVQQARDAALEAGALQLLVDVVRGSLPQLVLGQVGAAAVHPPPISSCALQAPIVAVQIHAARHWRRRCRPPHT